ncbi:MAG: hypothetical protein JW730_11545 [Anaerolineales bacterium]|nr:hypothetical protein [Anaerolineales bacterium]
MSGFAVAFERSNIPVDPGVLERVAPRLAHRGPDGYDEYRAGQIAMAHWHFWTTPEEVDERQPLQLAGMPFRLVFDGRLDNRSELLSRLHIDPAQGISISDAALVLHAFGCWGELCFEHFIGEFALVIFDEQSNRLICARDALGDRTLFYASRGPRLIIASEPWAVAGADGSEPQINDRAVAHYFALKATEDGQTLFTGVYELLPAHVMVVDSSGEHKRRYWRPDPSKKVRYKTKEEYGEHFRSLLEESVRCRLRARTPVGVLMSGGLDSTSVACLAARMIAAEPLTTISYVFDELAECDERVYINAVRDQYGLRSIQIPCDDAWPYKDWQAWPHNPNYPEGNPYRPLKERAYDRAHTEGLRVLLTGGFGDHLYSGADDWLADLISERKLREAVREAAIHLRYAGLRYTIEQGSLQRIARRFLNTIPGGRSLHRRQIASAWLTPAAAGCLSMGIAGVDAAFESRANLIGVLAARGSSGEIYHSNRHTLELRHPYRDRRLVEYALGLPAYLLYYRGLYKRVLRVSMRDILPESIRTRPRPTSLVSLFSRGIEREKAFLQSCYQTPDAVWRIFVRPDWLLKRWDVHVTPETDGPQALVPWLCASYALWYRSHRVLNQLAL